MAADVNNVRKTQALMIKGVFNKGFTTGGKLALASLQGSLLADYSMLLGCTAGHMSKFKIMKNSPKIEKFKFLFTLYKLDTESTLPHFSTNS